MNKKKDIENLLLKIIRVLKKSGETNWNNSIINFHSELLNADTLSKQKNIARRILRIYGGMGSFTDLVLFRNKTLCIDENNELNKLRKELHKELLKVLDK